LLEGEVSTLPLVKSPSKAAESPERLGLSGGGLGVIPQIQFYPLSCRRGARGEVSARIMGLKAVFQYFMVPVITKQGGLL